MIQFNHCFVNYALTQALFCEGAQEVLDACKHLNFKMALFTHEPVYGQRKKIENLKLNHWISAFYLSEEQAIAKPTAQVFLKICDDFQVNASECLMVGDDLNNDILPALQLEMQVFLGGKSQCYSAI